MTRFTTFVRILLAGPGAIAMTLLVMCAMPLWMPTGAADIDHLILPLIILPAIWALSFFYACLDRSVVRVAIVIAAVALCNGAALTIHFVRLGDKAAPHGNAP